MISAGCRAVDSGPVKNSLAHIVRAPAAPTRVISASQVTAIPGSSAAGSAWGKTAAEGAAVADLIMRDVHDGVPQQRVCGLQPPIVLNVACSPATPMRRR